MPADPTLALAALILVVAFLYSSVGHAGASGYLAAMALMGVAAEVMRPTALALNIIVATITTVQFARAGHFRWRLFWPFAAASIPAAFLGGQIVLPGAYYKPLIGAVLLFSAWRMVAGLPSRGAACTPGGPRGQAPGTQVSDARPPSPSVMLLVGAGLGFVAGLTGTGGGIFLSPLMILCGWADPKRTGAVSAAFILVNSVSGIAGLLTKVGSLPAAVPLWGVCAVVGGVVGSYLGARKLDVTTLRKLLAVVLVIAGAKLIAGG